MLKFKCSGACRGGRGLPPANATFKTGTKNVGASIARPHKKNFKKFKGGIYYEKHKFDKKGANPQCTRERERERVIIY